MTEVKGDIVFTILEPGEVPYRLEVEPILSDLEIVQKALEKELMNVNIDFNGDWVLYKGSQEVNGGHDLDFLVSWAKQQLGE